MAGPTQEQAEAIRRLAEAAGSTDELIRWVRGVAGRRPGRPAGSSRLAPLDNALIEAARKAAERSGVPEATLLRLNVQMGCMTRYGAKKESVIERLRVRRKQSSQGNEVII